jgi:hypothetical protein
MKKEEAKNWFMLGTEESYYASDYDKDFEDLWTEHLKEDKK